MTTKHVDLTLGLILLKDGKLSKEQLKRALLKQGEIRRFGRVTRLGEVIAKLGLLDEAEIASALAIQETLLVPSTQQTALGLLLIDAGLVTPSQVFDALIAQQIAGQRLGEILVERGLLSTEQLEPFLRQQEAQRAALERQRASEAAPAPTPAEEDEFVIFDMGGRDEDLAAYEPAPAPAHAEAGAPLDYAALGDFGTHAAYVTPGEPSA